jgi:DNA-binding Xre family transcriptional regulator
MSGEQLKKILGKTGKSYVEIAALLGISSQSLYQMFKADDIKSGMIEKLCNVLNEDVTLFYGGGDKISAVDHSLAINGNGNSANNDTGAFLALLTKKDEQIDRLLGIIEQMNK